MANKYNNIVKLAETPAAITPGAGVQNIYGKADNLLYAKNSLGVEYLLNNPLNYLNVLAAAFPTVAQTTTTRVPVTSWSFPVVAGKSYKIEVNANYTTAVATTGGSLGVSLPTGTGNIVGYMEATLVNTGSATAVKQSIYAIGGNGLFGSFLTSTGLTGGGIGNFILDCVFTCTTTGTFEVDWGTEVANSLAQLTIGSTLIMTMLN